MTSPEAFWAKVDKGPGCWLWRGSLQGGGYGHVTWNGRSTGAHRVAWLLTHGKLPEHTIDHLCRNRVCVRPDHLEDVTMRENVLRGIGHTAVNAAKDRCDNGHEFTPENTWIRKQGHRRCRECHRAEDRKRRSKPPLAFSRIPTGGMWRRTDPRREAIVVMVTQGADEFWQTVIYRTKDGRELSAQAHYWRWRYEPA